MWLHCFSMPEAHTNVIEAVIIRSVYRAAGARKIVSFEVQAPSFSIFGTIRPIRYRAEKQNWLSGAPLVYCAAGARQIVRFLSSKPTFSYRYLQIASKECPFVSTQKTFIGTGF